MRILWVFNLLPCREQFAPLLNLNFMSVVQLFLICLTSLRMFIFQVMPSHPAEIPPLNQYPSIIKIMGIKTGSTMFSLDLMLPRMQLLRIDDAVSLCPG